MLLAFPLLAHNVAPRRRSMALSASRRKFQNQREDKNECLLQLEKKIAEIMLVGETCDCYELKRNNSRFLSLLRVVMW